MTAVGASAAMIGCFAKPNSANIELRKQVQTLESKEADLDRRHDADVARIAQLSTDRTIQTLPADKMDRLYMTSAIKFKNLAVGEDSDPASSGDEGFKVGVVPIDLDGDEFKAAGSFKVELFDLAAADPRLGNWTLDAVEARKVWMSSLVFDGYVLAFAWQTPPAAAKLTAKVTFVEELTGRSFDATREFSVRPPGSQVRASSPASAAADDGRR